MRLVAPASRRRFFRVRDTQKRRRDASATKTSDSLKGKSMFQVSVDESFSAGHALRGYKGKCENPHGHNYKVRIILEGPGLDSIGLLYDFTHLKRVIRDIVEGVDHKFLNDQAPFDVINPSAENLAKFFYDETSRQMKAMPEGARIARVTVWETDTTSATYWS
jgi:6-pyruvoyltetrahydropterin/6-carboxytetrahydropterin synthase